jgi:hypothetical protein
MTKISFTCKMSLPSDFMSSKTQPNLPIRNNGVVSVVNFPPVGIPPHYVNPFAPILPHQKSIFENKEFFSDNKMSAKPVDVLPNGNVVMSHGGIVDGGHVSAMAAASNKASYPTEARTNGMMKMANGNHVNKNAGGNPGMPVGLDHQGNVVMSNGDTVHPNMVAALPASPPTAANTSGAVASSNMHPAMAASGGCPIAPPTEPMRYCRPAPFHSENGQKYFYVPEAYGTPMAG